MNALGNFEYRNIQPSLFWGYESLGNKGQTAFMATAEKALLDMFYLNHIKISLDYLKDFRLQNVEHIRKERLFEYARRFKKSGVLKCAQTIADYIKMYTQGEKTL